MFQKRAISRLLDVLQVFSVFFTPLLFFVRSHDQFELPKLTFLVLLAAFAVILQFQTMDSFAPTPLTWALLGLFLLEMMASLPATSLSWRTSLLGDYENFSGLSTWILYLMWFWIFSRNLTAEKVEKIFYFNSLAAFLSALYAIGQHFQLDFIQWNPESVNASREFAALGNPNFLSAYLAMSAPLFLCVSLKPFLKNGKNSPAPSILWWFLGILGLFFLLGSTDNILSLLNLEIPSQLISITIGVGLSLFSVAFIRFSSFQNGAMTFIGLIVLILGLFCTGSRGGFLAEVLGLGLWMLFILRSQYFSGFFRKTYEKIPKTLAILALIPSFLLFFFLGRGFLVRLGTSILHAGQSLAVSRLHIWVPAVKMAAANPLLGVGLDNFKVAFPYYSGFEYNLIDGIFNSSRMAHNELLQMACTTGFLGLLAYLGVLGAFVFLGWKAYSRSEARVQWILMAVFASAMAYHVQNIFSFGVASINLLWFLLLAIVQMVYRKCFPSLPSSGSFPSRFWALLKKTTLGILSIFILWFPLDRLGADIAFGQSNAASEVLKHPDPQIAPSGLLYYSDYEIEHLKKAVSLCPLEVKYELYLGLAYEQRAQIDTDHALDWNQTALECYTKAVQMSPANAYYYNDLGRVQAFLGHHDPAYRAQAEESYRKAVHFDPSSPFFNINWANSLQDLGKNSESEIQLEKAFELDPSFTSKVLAQMGFEKYRSGEKPRAFQLLDEAVRGNTSSAEAYYCRGILYLSEKKKSLALRDLEKVKSLNPTPEKNPSIQGLDQFIDQAKK